MEDLYTENYKTWMKEMTWKDIPWSLMRRISIFKYPYHPKKYTDSINSLSIL
jgi:hypothetical protein